MRSPGLRARLVLALLATAAATLAVAALALLPPLESRLRADAARSLMLHAEAARPGFERGEPSQRPLRALARVTGAQVALVSEHGVAAETDPGVPGDLADALYTRHNERAVHHGVAEAAIPLRIDHRPYALVLSRRLGDVGRTYDIVETAFAGAALAGLALALAAGFVLSGRMLRRLRTLSEAMHAADQGAPADVDTSPDEIGDLARAFAGLQQRLALQEESRRTFVATASHELRTPLASLQTVLELAHDEAGSEDPDLAAVRADLAEALGQARRLGGLARGLLDLSRLDAGVPLRREPLELGELSRAVAAEFRARRPRCVEPAEACWALADPQAVARIVRLLLDNALRYAPAPAPVEVRAEPFGAQVAVRVLDGGPGIAEAERQLVFERFQRGERTSVPGFGIGLAIGAELARRMDGELVIEDGAPAPGEPAGARFALKLPSAS